MIVKPCSIFRKTGAEPTVPGQVDQVSRIGDRDREATASE